MWKIFLSSDYVKNLIKFRATINRTKIAFSANRPLSASKMEGKGGFTQNAIFIRFCISCIFERFLMNELDGYACVFTLNAIASDFASRYPSLKSTHVF